MQPTDEQLQTWCRRLKGSDRQAYERVFRALHENLFRYALHITGEDGAARDVVQEVFLDLWDMRERLDPDRSLEALLYRMVRNKAYNRQRDRRTQAAKREQLQQERVLQHQEVDRPDSGLGGNDQLHVKLRAWIDELPARQREALTLSRFEGLTHDEIATVMDISPRTVNNHVVRALKSLRDQLHAFEPNASLP
jgi:RNA polymerase sigma-70 factor (ECF subfamily)